MGHVPEINGDDDDDKTASQNRTITSVMDSWMNIEHEVNMWYDVDCEVVVYIDI